MWVYSISTSSFSLIGTLTTEIYYQYQTDKTDTQIHRHKLFLFPTIKLGRVFIVPHRLAYLGIRIGKLEEQDGLVVKTSDYGSDGPKIDTKQHPFVQLS